MVWNSRMILCQSHTNKLSHYHHNFNMLLCRNLPGRYLLHIYQTEKQDRGSAFSQPQIQPDASYSPKYHYQVLRKPRWLRIPVHSQSLHQNTERKEGWGRGGGGGRRKKKRHLDSKVFQNLLGKPIFPSKESRAKWLNYLPPNSS